MPYARLDCGECGRSYEPKNITDRERGTCRNCAWARTRLQQSAQLTDLHLRDCEVCSNQFQAKPNVTRCPSCTKLARVARGDDDLPPKPHFLAPPLRQVVFDLETFALDRGWGVLMMGCLMVHGEGPDPKLYEFDLTQTKGWPNKRSDDREVAANILDVLRGCHVAYAHNGRWFDIPWLNSIALKYNLPTLNIKLVDPVQVARRKYRIGNNSLAAIAEFLGLEESKMQLGPDIWRFALMDNDPEAWRQLRERCRSDVRLLNEVAARVTRDVGMLDYQGSAYR